MYSILVLLIVVAGLGLMFGWIEPKQIGTLVAWLILGPILLCLASGYWLSFYNTLPLALRVLTWIALPFVLLIVLRALLPKATWVNIAFRALFDLLIFAATFPLRFIWRSARLIAEREHHPINLARHQAVVGQRPPQRIQQHSGQDHGRQ